MPTRAQIVSFAGDEAPPGESPWVAGRGPSPYVAVVEPDPSWPERSAQVAATVRSALGWRVLALEHVGSTAVAGSPRSPPSTSTWCSPTPTPRTPTCPRWRRWASCSPCVSRGGRATGCCASTRRRWGRASAATCTSSGRQCGAVEAPALPRLAARAPRRAGALRRREALRRRRRERGGEHSMLYNARKQDVVRAIYARAFPPAPRAVGLSSDPRAHQPGVVPRVSSCAGPGRVGQDDLARRLETGRHDPAVLRRRDVAARDHHGAAAARGAGRDRDRLCGSLLQLVPGRPPMWCSTSPSGRARCATTTRCWRRWASCPSD